MNLLKLGTEDQANLVKPVTKAGVYMALTSTDSLRVSWTMSCLIFRKASDIKVNHEKSRSMCSTNEEDIQEELDLVARNDLDLKMQDAPQSSSELLQSDSMNYRA
ncbi:hypothetical protein OIU77_026634 [Salix suchowensis]|uniref:Uncharacterized protein n=1 Tax=Salix suchowensis TaxID=1278906 RepID=A0ABQ9BNM1_9ROSI|nr:hypothetical protein OIU77_026634 [Salix suchowensis]